MERARIVCKEMVSQRGYKIISEKGDQMIAKKNSKKILIIFYEDEKISINIVKECLILLKEMKINHIILVYKEKFTSCAKQAVKLMGNIEECDDLTKIIFEVFNINELQINITKHILVPKHELATEEEINELLKTTKSLDKIPKIYTEDPMCKFYNFKVEDILRITRRNGFVTYRIVINVN